MNALGYIRISTEKQSEYSLEYQERIIREYCERHEVTLLAVFKDDGESSYSFDRPDWRALEAFIKKNKTVDYLVVLDHDRFSRNLAEALLKIKELQDKHKIKVLATSDPFDTDFADPSAFMMRAFKLMMAENELHNIRKRTKHGVLQAALNGRFINMAPYGYTNGRDENNKPVLVVNEDKAPIIRYVFKEYLAGADPEVIRAAIRKMGFKQSGNSAIRRILENCIYAGMIPVPAHKDRKSRHVKGIHIALISEQDYWLAQERLNKRRNTVQKNEEVPLRGALRCWCGRKVTAGNSRSHTGAYHWYYLCPEHKANLPAKKLHKQFGELLDHMSLGEERIQWLREKLTAEIGQYLDNQGGMVKATTREIKTLSLKIESVETKWLLKPDASEASYNKVIGELRADLARKQQELAKANTNQQVYFSRLHFLLNRLSHLRDAYENMTLDKKQQFVNIGFDNSLYYRDGIYRTHSIHPYLSDNLLALKEKGLLVVEKPVIKLGETPLRTRDGN